MKPVRFSLGLCLACGLAVGSFIAALNERQLTSFLPTGVILREAPGWLELREMPSALIAGEPNKIPLYVRKHKAESAFVTVSYYDDDHQRLPPDTFSKEPVAFSPNGTPYVVITPNRVGEAHIDVEVLFQHGFNDTAAADLPARLPDRKPVALMVRQAGDGFSRPEGTIPIELTAAGARTYLQAAVLYRAGGTPVVIPAGDIRSKVISAEGKPSSFIIVNSTRFLVVTANEYGHALILSSYDGATDLTCVAVMRCIDQGGDPDCHELVLRAVSKSTTHFHP